MQTTQPTTAPRTNYHVTDADKRGAVVRDDRGRQHRIAWGTLRAAAGQDDRGLARIYAALLEQAEALAAESAPIELRVERDSTNVWWVVTLRAAWGGGPVRLASGRPLFRRDELGTHALRAIAEGVAKSVIGRARAAGRDIAWVS